MLGGELTIWTIFERPADFPGRAFVVAVDVIGGDPPHRRPERWFADDLAGARAIVRGNDPSADFRLDRHPTDEPCIVECWL